MALAIKYYFTFYDILGVNHKVEILKEGYTGASTDISEKTGSSPVSITSLGVDNKFKTIIGTECTINLMIETAFEYAEFLTATYKDYQIKYYYYSVSWLIEWIGWVVPESYLEPHTTPPYEFMIRATCGLGSLQYIKYETATDVPYTGQDDLMSIISNCLLEIGNGLPIVSAVNFFATGMTETATYDPLNQAYVNQELFREECNVGGSCYDVLDKIMKIFMARILLTGGAWAILSLDDITTDQTYRLFLANGTYSSNSTLTNNKATITLPSASPIIAYIDNQQQIEVESAWKDFTVIQDCGFRADNIVEDFEFKCWRETNRLLLWDRSTSGTWLEQVDDGCLLNTQSATIGAAKYIYQTPITQHLTSGYTLDIDINFTKHAAGVVYFRIKIFNGTSTYYLQNTAGAWTTTPTDVTTSSPINITTAALPINDCDVYIRLYEVVHSSASSVTWEDVTVKPNFGNLFIPSTIKTKTVIDVDNMASPTDIELALGSAEIFTIHNEEIMFWNSLLNSSGDALTDWHHKGDTDHDTMMNHLIQVYSDQQDAPSFKLRGNILSGQSLGHQHVLTDTINSATKKFIPGNLNYNVKRGTWEGDWYEIK